MSVIQLSAVVEIRAEHVTEFESAIDLLTVAAASESGVVEYRAWQDRTEPGRFLILESYADQQALDTHMALPTVIDFVTRLPAWLASDSHAALHTLDSVGRIPLNSAGVPS